MRKNGCRPTAVGTMIECAGMKSAWNRYLPLSGNGRGLYGLQLTVRDSEAKDKLARKASRFVYVLKDGQHIEEGIVLNYCPFCGNKIGG